MSKQELIEPVVFGEKREFIPVDEWTPKPEDEFFKTDRGTIRMDVSSYFGLERNVQLDSFIMSAKRAYNNPNVRTHTVHYLNYFEKFYDEDHELPLVYSRIKYLIDFEPSYTAEAFMYDLQRYIMSGTIALKFGYMNKDNYSLSLTYKNVKNPNLQYSD